MAHGCERDRHIGQKDEEGEPGAPGRVACPVGFVQKPLGFLGHFRGLGHSGRFRQAW